MQSVAVIVVVIATVVMGIWVVDATIFTRIFPQLATMKFNTALLFNLVALHLCFSNLRETNNYRFDVLALIIGGIASFTFIAYWLNAPSFLDELFVADPLTPLEQFPGRMSQATAFMFMLFAVTLLIYQHWVKVAEFILVCINLMGLVALFAYLFDATALYDILFFSSVSFHTAFLFVLLSTCAILTLPNGYIHDLIILNEPGGAALRWLLPIVLFIPFGVGWLVVQGFHQGYYQPAIAIDILVVSIVMVQLILAIVYANTTQAWYLKDRENQKQLADSKLSLVELEHIREMKELKEDFFAKISHDMKQPITTIVVSSDLMLKYDERLKAEGRMRHTRRIRGQALSMLDFVDDILLLSQIELNEIPFNPMTADIASFSHVYVQDFLNGYETDLHQLVLEIPTEPIQINYDEKLVRRLLGNLLSNAIKYSPDGGNITFAISATDTDVIVSVTDEGVGIPEEDIATLFDLFERASNVDQFKGHGIGLAIVQQIVTLHQAQIDVQSAVDVGTTFRVISPRV